MRNYVIFRVALTVQLLFFFFYSCVFVSPKDLDPSSPGFFQLPVLAMAVLAMLNDGVIIAVAYDEAAPSLVPEKWDLQGIFLAAGAIGLVPLISSVWMLNWGLEARQKPVVTFPSHLPECLCYISHSQLSPQFVNSGYPQNTGSTLRPLHRMLDASPLFCPQRTDSRPPVFPRSGPRCAGVGRTRPPRHLL